MVDRENKVFVPDVVIECGQKAVVKVPGHITQGGCGTEPPPNDLYAEAPGGTSVSPRPVPVTVPVCLELVPDEGFSHPP